MWPRSITRKTLPRRHLATSHNLALCALSTRFAALRRYRKRALMAAFPAFCRYISMRPGQACLLLFDFVRCSRNPVCAYIFEGLFDGGPEVAFAFPLVLGGVERDVAMLWHPRQDSLTGAAADVRRTAKATMPTVSTLGLWPIVRSYLIWCPNTSCHERVVSHLVALQVLPSTHACVVDMLVLGCDLLSFSKTARPAIEVCFRSFGMNVHFDSGGVFLHGG